ncbi:MAG: hypothetical protein LAT56_11475 [Wenzhouxiangella sp.]|nr:hypothetical protein [Wenzhouxiangella sp.]
MRSFFQTLISFALLAGSGWASASVPGQWQDAFRLSPGCDAAVRAMAERPDGKIYIGGTFRFCDGVKVNRIALFDPVANTFEPLVHNGVVGVNSTVRALAWGDGELFVGGALTMAGTLEVDRLARWNGSAWQRLGSGLSNGVSLGSGTAQVWSMVWVNDSLYVGGRFDSAALVAANNIARWSAGQWHRLGTPSDNGVTGGTVVALEAVGSNVVAGGTFNAAGAAPANRLALWNGSSWSTIGAGPVHGPGFGSTISTITAHAGDLYVGGELNFADAGGSVCGPCVMRWDGSAWHALPFEPTFGSSFLDTVDALASHDGQLYVGVTNFSGQPGGGLRRWSGSQWQTLGGTDETSIGVSLLSISQGLLVGGTSNAPGATPRYGLMRWAGSQFFSAGQPGGQGSSFIVTSVLEHEGQIYAARGVAIARWDGSEWTSLPGRFNGSIFALAMYQGMLYAGGVFSQINGEPALRIARFDGTDWLPVGGGITGEGGLEPLVRDLKVVNGQLYVAGEFDQAGSVTANSIATWNGSNWAALSSLFGNGLESDLGSLVIPGNARSLASDGNDIYVVGAFNRAGGSAATGIARWDGSNWFSVGGGLSSSPRSVAWHEGAVHIGGTNLQDAQGSDSGTVARLSSGQWQVVMPSQTMSSATNLVSHEGWLYAAGSGLAAVDGDALARWNGQQWQRFDTGVLFGDVRSLAVTDQRLSIGGSFQQVGPHASHYFAIFDFGELADAIFADRFQTAASKLQTRR